MSARDEVVELIEAHSPRLVTWDQSVKASVTSCACGASMPTSGYPVHLAVAFDAAGLIEDPA